MGCFDCKKLHHVCKAGCCTITPIPKDLWNECRGKVVEKVEEVKEGLQVDPETGELKDFVVPFTKSLKCPFLNEDLSCNIYEKRPYVCRKFGDESHKYLRCHFQDKDGRIRTRQERRSLERDTVKAHEVLMKRALKEEKEERLKII